MSKFCPNCGEEISEKVKFCPKCGVDIDSFSVKKDEKSNVEEPKKEIKIEDTKIENKKTGTTYNIKNLAVYGVIAVVVIIIFLMAMAFFAGISGNIQSSPKITPAPTTITTSQMVVITTPTGVAPTLIKITITPTISDKYVALITTTTSKYIAILPISNKHVGDKFTIVANTNIDVGESIRVGIYPFSAKYLESVVNSPSLPQPIVTGMSKVMSGNKFAFPVDLSTFKPGEYTVIVTDSTNTIYNYSEFSVLQ
jgi:hypothetical protein